MSTSARASTAGPPPSSRSPLQFKTSVNEEGVITVTASMPNLRPSKETASAKAIQQSGHPPRTHPPAHEQDTSPPSSSTSYTDRKTSKASNTSDAVEYLDRIKAEFAETPDVYNEFLSIVADYKSQMNSPLEVMKRVARLFSGHSGLIASFTSFLPPGYSIECGADYTRLYTPTRVYSLLPSKTQGSAMSALAEQTDSLQLPGQQGVEEDEQDSLQAPQSAIRSQSPHDPSGAQAGHTYSRQNAVQRAQDARPLPDVSDALGYLDRVKDEFETAPDVYRQCISLMGEFKSQKIDTPRVVQRVAHLFAGHSALVEGFTTFLPSGYRIECVSDCTKVYTPDGVETVLPDKAPNLAPPVTATNARVEPTPSRTRPRTAGSVQEMQQLFTLEAYKVFMDVLRRCQEQRQRTLSTQSVPCYLNAVEPPNEQPVAP